MQHAEALSTDYPNIIATLRHLTFSRLVVPASVCTYSIGNMISALLVQYLRHTTGSGDLVPVCVRAGRGGTVCVLSARAVYRVYTMCTSGS